MLDNDAKRSENLSKTVWKSCLELLLLASSNFGFEDFGKLIQLFNKTRKLADKENKELFNMFN